MTAGEQTFADPPATASRLLAKFYGERLIIDRAHELEPNRVKIIGRIEMRKMWSKPHYYEYEATVYLAADPDGNAYIQRLDSMQRPLGDKKPEAQA